MDVSGTHQSAKIWVTALQRPPQHESKFIPQDDQISDTIFPRCDNAIEDAMHIFLVCTLASQLWTTLHLPVPHPSTWFGTWSPPPQPRQWHLSHDCDKFFCCLCTPRSGPLVVQHVTKSPSSQRWHKNGDGRTIYNWICTIIRIKLCNIIFIAVDHFQQCENILKIWNS